MAELVGAAVKEARQRRGISQAALARAAGAGKATVIQLEAGTCGVSIYMLCKLALAMGVEPGSLMPSAEDLADAIGPVAVIDKSAMTRTSQGGNKYNPAETPRGAKYLAAVIAGVRKFVIAHGKQPPTNGRDATAYVGFRTTWTAINSTLLKGGNGVEACGGLSKFIRERGLALRGAALERAIQLGAQAYADRHSRLPHTKDGDASAYVGKPGTWSTWDRVLRTGRHGTTAKQSLAQFLAARGVHGPSDSVSSAHMML
jgi:transcriptional regulator with XRE-family HTH domain